MDTEATFDSDYNLEENPVLSTLDTMVYWRQFLKDLLPDTSKGIVVVFENACTVSFTYQIL
jgi:hypothetical protein